MKASVYRAGEPLRDGHPAVSLASGKQYVLYLIPVLVKKASVQKTGHQLTHVWTYWLLCPSVPILLKANVESQAHGFLFPLFEIRRQEFHIFEIYFPHCKIWKIQLIPFVSARAYKQQNNLALVHMPVSKI